MWLPSEELRAAFIHKEDVKREPQLYPKDLVDIIRRMDVMKDDDERWDYLASNPEIQYSVEGYIIRPDFGLVGIRPDSSEAVKGEWMEYWNAGNQAFRDGLIISIF